MNTAAPVAVFAYARPEHMRRTLTSLTGCEGAADAPITVFIDGPRSPEKVGAVEAVHTVAVEMLGSAADIRRAPTNLGLARSITKGVADLLEHDGRVIVVEDDLELAPGFLEYMNIALDRYETEKNIYQVSGHMFDVPEFADRSRAMLLPFTTTWGWATWSRAWKNYDSDAHGWQSLRTDAKLRRRFDLGGAYPYSWLMERQASGLSDSWGIRWYWSVFKADGLTVFPPQSLVCNIGQDGSGTHGRGIGADFSGEQNAWPAGVPELPDSPEVNAADLAAVSGAIWRQNGGWPGRALLRLRKILGR